MSLPQRARIILAQEEDAPAADVLRLVQPKAYLGVMAKVCATFDSKSAEEGIEFVRLLPNMDVRPRALAAWSWKDGASKLAGSAAEHCANVGKGASDVPTVGF